MDCLNLSQIIAYQNKLLGDKENKQIKQHLSTCTDCIKQINTYQDFGNFLKRTISLDNPEDTSECYDEFELTSFLEGGNGKTSRANLYRHLTNCQYCMDKFLAIENLLGELKSEGLLASVGTKEKPGLFLMPIIQSIKDKLWSIWDLIGIPTPAYRWLGIAVILIIVAFVFLPQDSKINSIFNTRETQLNSFDQGVLLIYPTDEIRIDENKVEFCWRKVSEASKYTLLLLDANGDIVWEKQTSTSTLKLPQEISLLPSMTYFWQVEAFFEDGSSLVSEMSSFTITR